MTRPHLDHKKPKGKATDECCYQENANFKKIFLFRDFLESISHTSRSLREFKVPGYDFILYDSPPNNRAIPAFCRNSKQLPCFGSANLFYIEMPGLILLQKNRPFSFF